MPVLSTATSSGPYVGNGSTTVFPFGFAAASSSEITVIADGVTIDPYLYAVMVTDTGGSVTFTVAPVAGAITIESNPDFTQQTSLQNHAAFLPEVIGTALDRAAIRDLFLLERIGRTVVVPDGEAGFTLPPAAQRAGLAGWLGGELTSIALPAGLTAQQTITVPDRATMAALASPVADQVVFLAEAGREGFFKTFAGTAPAVGDMLQALYVQSTAGSFYYARLWDGVHGRPEWFGALPNTSDCLGPLQVAVGSGLIPELAFVNDDYYISNTLNVATNTVGLQGIRGRSQYRGAGTRIIVTSATAHTMLLGTEGNPAGGINAFVRDVRISGLTLTRSVAPAVTSDPANGPTGLRTRFVLNCHVEGVFLNEHQIGLSYAGAVGSRFVDCHAFRSAASSSSNEGWTGHFADGSVSFGAAGGNASLYIEDSGSEFAGSWNTTGQAIDGLACNLAFVDTFVTNFETSACNRGLVVVGTGSGGSAATNIDFRLRGSTLDACTLRGVEISNIQPSGVVTLVDTYCATTISGFAGIHVHDSTGTIKLDLVQLFDNPSLTTPNPIGILGENSSNIEVTGATVVESLAPFQFSNCSNISITGKAVNVSHSPAGAAFAFASCNNLRVIPSLSGTTGGFNGGVSLTTCTYATVDQTLIAPAMLAAGHARVLNDGTAVTTPGTFGTSGYLVGA